MTYRFARTTLAVLLTAGGPLAVAMAPTLAGASAPAPEPGPVSTGHVIGSGVVDLTAGDWHWRQTELGIDPVAALLVEPGSPRFVLARAGDALVEGPRPVWLHAGDATFEAGSALTLTALDAPAQIDLLSIEPATADDTSAVIAVTGGRYDLDVLQHVAPTGSSVTVASELPVFVLVTSGAFVDATGTVWESGVATVFDGRVELIASGTEPSSLVAATVEALPASGGAAATDGVPATEPTDGPASSPATTVVTATTAPSATTAAPTTVPPTTAAPVDSDGDGLTDDAERTVHGSNPNNRDSDGDTLSDGDEVNRYGSNPTMVDTDSDGVDDDDEVKVLGSNPNDWDSDGDELDDYVEWTAYGTSPINPDTDGDLDYDGYEVRMGTNPLDPTDFTT